MPGKKALRKKHIFIGPPGNKKPADSDHKALRRFGVIGAVGEEGRKRFFKHVASERRRMDRYEMNNMDSEEKQIYASSLKEVVNEANKNIKQIVHRARKAEQKLAKKQLQLLAPKNVPADVINAIVKMI